MAEEIPNGGTAYKCCPPIRESGNRELLWQGLLDGTIDYIASDHSPSTLELKDLENGDFGVAWGGIASVQLGLSLVWTEARRRGISLEQVVSWMASKPADRVRLRSKGRLALGYDADLAIFGADDAYVVDAAKLHHKNPLTPYHGKTVSGLVRKTFVRGTGQWTSRPRTAGRSAAAWTDRRPRDLLGFAGCCQPCPEPVEGLKRAKGGPSTGSGHGRHPPDASRAAHLAGVRSCCAAGTPARADPASASTIWAARTDSRTLCILRIRAPFNAQTVAAASEASSRSPRSSPTASPTKSLLDTAASSGSPRSAISVSRLVISSECRVFLFRS